MIAAPSGGEAGDTRLHLSAMTKFYRQKDGTRRLDMGGITAVEIFDGGDVWSKRRGIAAVSRNVKWPTNRRWPEAAETTADVLVLAGSAAAAEPRLENNDHMYLEEDGLTGRLRVRVEVS